MCESYGKYLLDLTKPEKKEFLASFDYVCLGCDGVLWDFLSDYPNVTKAIQLLERAGKQITYTTNNGLHTKKEVMVRLLNMGVEHVTEEQIIHPTQTIIEYCTNHLKNEPILTLCSDELNATLQDKLKLVYPSTETLDTKCDFIEKLVPNDRVAAVLLDTNFNLHFSHLALALRYLQQNPDCKLLINAMDSHLPLNRNVNMLGMGGFLTMLKMCARREPIVLGKPGKYFRCMLPEHMKMGKPTRTLLIGDNIRTDIRFGNNCGFQTVLVCSGVTSLDSLKKSTQVRPKYWMNSFDEFIKFFAGVRC